MKVTKINAIPSLETKKNVAAYARVSNGKDAMLHSLSAQVSYYSKYIQSHDDWEYVGVYADEALTGTKDTRENFQRLLADCRAGKIDIVMGKGAAHIIILTASGRNKFLEFGHNFLPASLAFIVHPIAVVNFFSPVKA